MSCPPCRDGAMRQSTQPSEEPFDPAALLAGGMVDAPRLLRTQPRSTLRGRGLARERAVRACGVFSV